MHSEKVGAFRANRTEKVGAKKKGGITAAHTRTALIWEYPLQGYNTDWIATMEIDFDPNNSVIKRLCTIDSGSL